MVCMINNRSFSVVYLFTLSMAAVLDFLHKILVTGALSKGWGGPQCRAALDIQTHIVESAVWLTVGAIAFVAYKAGPKFTALCRNIKLDLAKSTPTTAARTFELIMATIHIGMFIQIIYYKVNILSLVNMIQPCHVILLLQGIALYSTGTTGVVISLCVLPSLTGTLLAMLFPDTGGLDQPYEMDAYWIQHYLVQAVPLYLLVRRDYVALRHASYLNVFLGLWTLLILHFSLYEVGSSALSTWLVCECILQRVYSDNLCISIMYMRCAMLLYTPTR